jgi:E3 ubiquitin-protein ligase DOA10
MVAPCACKGSLQHVHTSCLMRWALERAALGAAHGCLVCEVCHTDFALPATRKEELQQALAVGEKAK